MSIIKFVREWTLPAAMVTGAVVYVVFALTPALGGVSALLAPMLYDSILVYMFALMFVMFCNADFHRMRIRKWHLWVISLQLLLVVAVMVPILAFRPEGEWLVLGEAVVACVVCPCANAAAVVTQKLGGSMEEMTAYCFVSNLATAVLIPVCFPLVEKSAGVSFVAAMGAVFEKTIIMLVLPMVAAWIVKHRVRRLHARIVRMRNLAYYIWAVSLATITGITVSNIVSARAAAWLVVAMAVAAAVMCVVQFGVGRAVGKRFGRTVCSGQALGQKNTSFAIWMASTYLNPLSSVAPGFYIIWQNTINSIEIRIEEKRVSLLARLSEREPQQ